MEEEAKIPRTVAVIGLGKLGSPVAAGIAAHGISVVGADLDGNKVKAINHGEPPVNETDLTEYIRRGRANLRATTDIQAAISDADITFVIVPTPSEPNGGFSLRHVLSACEAIGRGLKKKKGFPVIVITSTVMPGSTGGPIRECLEKHSGRKAGRDFGLCYSPEFIALGSVVRDFLNPDFILVGESDPRSGEILDAFYQVVCDNHPPVAHMNHINAELSKLAVNTYVTTKIVYANMIAHLCERLPGADVDVVTKAIGRDSRIGGKYLKGAIGYGGPCFPRDNLAMGRLARDLGLQAALADTTDRENRAEVRRLAELVRHHARPGSKIGVLGLSYKPDTDVIEESQGIQLVQLLIQEDCDVLVYDPMALKAAQLVLGEGPTYTASAEDCVRQSDVVVITTPWKAFGRIGADAVSGRRTRQVLIDAWRIAPAEWRAKTLYVPVGVKAFA